MTIELSGKSQPGNEPEDAAPKTTENIGLRSDGELVQAHVDAFDLRGTEPDDNETAAFLTHAVSGVRVGAQRTDTDDGDAAKTVSAPPETYESHDDTPYDDDIPKEFRAADPPPPPFDKEDDDDGLADTLVWTNTGDVEAKAGESGDYDDFLSLMSFDPTSLPPTNGDGPPYLDVNGGGTEDSAPAMTDDFILA